MKADLGLEQIVQVNTREKNCLDLVFTNRPSLANQTEDVVGVSDHAAILLEVTATITRAKPICRKVFLWSKSNLTEIKAEATRLTTSILHSNSTDCPVEEIWQTLKTSLKSLVNKHVPSKMTSTRHNQPWVNTNIKRLAKQKQQAYKKAKQTQKWERYHSLKSELQRFCRQAHDQYVNNLITDAGSNAKKKLWTYVKSKRNDKVGVSPLKKDGQTYSDSKTHTNILNDQFSSVFTTEPDNPLPRLGPAHNQQYQTSLSLSTEFTNP